MHFASYNSNYVNYEDNKHYKASTVDGKTVIRFVDVHQLDEATNYGIRFSVKIPSDATAGDYDVAIEAKVAKDNTTENTEKLLTADEITVTAGKITVTPDCEHEWGFVSATPATASANGSISFKCSKCNETKTEAVSYYANYRAAFVSAAYDSEICLLFAARKDRLAEQGAYSDAYMVFSREASTGAVVSATNITNTTDTVEGSNSRSCKTWSYPIRSIELTDTVSANLYVCVGNAWYNGISSSYSVKTYAMTVLPTAVLTEQKLIANMLTYGAKMQLYKNYKTNSLADANLGTYASLVTATAPTITYTRVDNHRSTDVYINKYNFSMDARTTATLYFCSDKYTGENKSDYTVVVSWTDKDNVAQTITYYPASNTAAEYTYGPELDASGAVRTNCYMFTFDSFKSFDYRRDFTINIYDGETEVSHGYTTNFESLIANGIEQKRFTETEVTAYHAMMNYGDAAAAHFIG